jgi:hypothetical protein
MGKGLGAMKKFTILMLLTGIFIGATSAYGQAPAARRTGSVDPCLGGGGTGILETIIVASLERLVRMSDLILVGTVANVLPATHMSASNWDSIETTSLISVNEVLRGTLADGTKTISISQLGGQVEPCGGLLIPDDPLFKLGEDYVLFLWADNRAIPPNTTGAPRYSSVGVWSGKAKIVGGKVQFLPRASQDLHKYDNTDAGAFITTVKDRIAILFPRH